MSTSPVVTPRRGRPPVIKAENEELTFAGFLKQNPNEIRFRYRATLSKSEALEELARIRQIGQWAAEEINQRLIPDEDTCMICKKNIASGQKVTQMVNVRDDATGTISTKVLCSILCVREYNRVKMGLAELVK